MKKTFAVLALVVLAASACGEPDVNLGAGGSNSGSSESPASDDEPVSSGALDPSLDPEPKASPVEPNPDAVNTLPIRWDSYEERAGGKQLEMFFWSGVEPCYVLADVEVEETPTKVIVTLHQGNLESDEETACIEIAVLKSTLVDLAEPLADRKVVDGARKG